MATRWTNTLRSALGVLGVASALISVLIGFRSAYLYIANKGTLQAEIDSWLAVAAIDHNESTTNSELLTYLQLSAYAAEQAQSLDTGDSGLELSAYLAFAEYAAMDLEYLPQSYDYWREYLPELIAEGWRLRELTSSPEKRSDLLQLLARLESSSLERRGFENAMSLLREAIALEPDNPEPKYLLASLLLDHKQEVAEAEATLSSLVQDHPGQPRYATRLAYWLLSRERLEDALPLLKTAASAPKNDMGFADRQEIERAKALLKRELERAIEHGKPLELIEDEFVDQYLANRLVSGEFYIAQANKVLAGVYWWQRGYRSRAAHLLFESAHRFRTDNVSDLVEDELRWYGLSLQDLPPSLEELRTVEPSYKRDVFSNIAVEYAAYLAQVQERTLLPGNGDPGPSVGAVIQYWPGEGLILQRVVPGYRFERAGAMPGDLLTAIDGTGVEDFPSLDSLLAQSDLVSLSVERRGEKIDLSAE
jgi:hypothetical protein